MPQLHPPTQIKHNSLFGAERSLLRIRTNSKQKLMICLINLSATLMTSHKIIQGRRVGGKKNETVHNLWCALEVKTDAK